METLGQNVNIAHHLFKNNLRFKTRLTNSNQNIGYSKIVFTCSIFLTVKNFNK